MSAPDNKKMAGGRFGDSKPYVPDMDNDTTEDGAGVPSDFPDNKTEVRTTWGDDKPLHGQDVTEPQTSDFSRDAAGMPTTDPVSKEALDLALEPNKFPRQTGHDTAEDIVLT